MRRRSRIAFGAVALAATVIVAVSWWIHGGEDEKLRRPRPPAGAAGSASEDGAPLERAPAAPAAPIGIAPFAGEPQGPPEPPMPDQRTPAFALRGVIRPQAGDRALVPAEFRVATRFLGTDLENDYSGYGRLAAESQAAWIPRNAVAPGAAYAIGVEEAGLHQVRLSAEGFGNVFLFAQSTSQSAEETPRLVQDLAFEIAEADRPDIEAVELDAAAEEGTKVLRAKAAKDGCWIAPGRWFLPGKVTVRLQREPASFTWNFSTSPVILHVPPAPALAVVVSAEATGAPLAGALIEVTRFLGGRGGGHSITSIRTHAGGAAVLPLGATREMVWHHTITVSHPEAVNVTLDSHDLAALPKSPEGAHVISLPAVNGIGGRLVDEAGQPLGVAAVSVFRGSTAYPMFSGRSDSGGRFAFAAASYQYAEVRAARTRRDAAAPSPPDEPYTLSVIRRVSAIPFLLATSLEELERGDGIFVCRTGIERGRVVVTEAATGLPVAGARVRLLPIVGGKPLFRLSRWPPSRTDAQGIAALGAVPANAWQIEVEAEGLARWRRDIQAAELSDLSVALARDGFQIKVRVVEGDDHPVADAYFMLQEGPTGDIDEETRTGADGRAFLDVPEDGAYGYYLAPIGPGRRASETNPEKLRPRAEPYVLRVVGLAERDIRLVAADGTEPPWAVMFAAPKGVPLSAARDRPWIARRALLPMPKEALSLWFATHAGRSAEVHWNAEAWDGKEDLVVRLEPGYRVAGRVVFDAASATGPVTVSARWMSIEGLPAFESFSGNTVEARVDPTTLRFAFDSLVAGRWLLAAAAPGVKPFEKEIDVPAPGEIVLSR